MISPAESRQGARRRHSFFDALRRQQQALPLRSPRPWHGMPISVWLRTLARGRFRLSPTRVPMALSCTAASVVNTGLSILTTVLHGRRFQRTRLEHAPLFILGHWRTGTTYLHELLVRDPRLNYSTTYQCMTPHHFLLTEAVLPRLLGFTMAKQRPMDAMSMGWQLPQEDEFAIMNLGAESPYLQWAYPCRELDAALDVEDLPPQRRRDWQRGLLDFIKRLSMRDGRRVVLKSPTHTARVKAILELFPDAQFVHIVRNPYEFIPSTVRTWQQMTEAVALHYSHEADFQSRVADNFRRMYQAFERDRPLIPPGQLVELQYEQLVADPIAQLETIYDRLPLGDFETAREPMERLVGARRGYRPSNYQHSPEQIDWINDLCGHYFEQYGYERLREGGTP